MSNWKETIKSRFNYQDERRDQVDSILSKMMMELSEAPYNLNAYSELISEYPLEWSVRINGKDEKICLSEIQDVLLANSWGETDEERVEDLPKAIENILVQKFSYL
ncbi:Uncharacterised protein [Actinobacillus pleuropneumoniae]|nr:Uncharacterised protein [Actinobacillus pleuropneumoniae]